MIEAWNELVATGGLVRLGILFIALAAFRLLSPDDGLASRAVGIFCILAAHWGGRYSRGRRK